MRILSCPITFILFALLFLLVHDVYAARNKMGVVSQSDQFNAAGSDSIERRQHLVTDVKNYALIYLNDYWSLLSSPARLTKKSTIRVGGIALAGGVVYAYDEEILAGLHRHRNNPAYKWFATAGEKIEPYGLVKTMNLIYAVGAVTGYVFNLKPLEDISVQLHEALLFGSLIPYIRIAQFRIVLISLSDELLISALYIIQKIAGSLF